MRQTVCFHNIPGNQTIGEYERLPPEVRKRMDESPYNLCAACVAQAPGLYMEQIERLEAKARRMEKKHGR